MIMKYERVKGIKEKEFRRLTRIKRKTFEKIDHVLKQFKGRKINDKT